MGVRASRRARLRAPEVRAVRLHDQRDMLPWLPRTGDHKEAQGVGAGKPPRSG